MSAINLNPINLKTTNCNKPPTACPNKNDADKKSIHLITVDLGYAWENKIPL